MGTMDPTKCTRLRDSFRAVADIIYEGLSTRRSAVANMHWTKWAMFCRDVALEPKLVLYRDLIHIINAFARQYRKEAITPSDRQVQSRMVEDAAR